MALIEFEHGITAIDTGFTRARFDASHLIERGGECAFVDTGTTFSVPRLLNALAIKDIAPSQVRYVLLTHVHLDHAGGAGELLRHLPNATAVIHPRGARHMIDPGRLIKGSIAVYGEAPFNRAYGQIVPIPQERVRIVEDGETLDLGGAPLTFIHTEGHARHHYCIVDEPSRSIFSGDTFGVSYREFDTSNGAFISPAATPTEFDPSAMHASIVRLMTYQPDAFFLTHYSRVTDVVRLARDLRADIDALVALVQACENDPRRAEILHERMISHYGERLHAHGVRLPEARWRDLIAIDVTLNVKGLEVWMDRVKKRASLATPSA